MDDGKEDYRVLDHLEADSGILPIVSNQDEETFESETLPESISILPLKNTVLFPGVVIPISAGRKKSLKLITEAHKEEKFIGVITQKSPEISDPDQKDLYPIGTIAKILRILELPDGSTTVIIEGKTRFKLLNINQTSPYLIGDIEKIPYSKSDHDKEFMAVIDTIRDVAEKIIRESDNIPSEAAFAIKNIENSSFLINFISSNMNLKVEEKQGILVEDKHQQRALRCLKSLNEEYDKLVLKNDIQSRVRREMDIQQREYYLHQQMKTIQEELGRESYEDEITEMRQKADKKNWDSGVHETFKKELSKLQRMNPQLAEYSVQRNYLDLLLDLPWAEYSEDNFDMKRAHKILDRDHFGLEKVKKRMIEFLAVLKLRKDLKSPLLCLVGPPGVGKTSLGKSIAEALGRSYVRISLGGLHDEAEIRGHRRTYIGALPGRIIQSIKKAKTSNPVFVLDEIDKLGKSGHGNPESAFLEVLDPEQNTAFYDNYLEMGYDLSKVLFIATANSLFNIHPALEDRMEIVDVSGYTHEEKVMIARKHLLPKQLKEHGVKKSQLNLRKPVIDKIIESYTYESGVRGLEKQVASVIRYVAKFIAFEQDYKVSPETTDLSEILGPEKKRRDLYESNKYAGLVTGLAWSRRGGSIIFFESTISKGRGKLSLTGNLGKIMTESVTIAKEYIKANKKKLSLQNFDFDGYDVHIHVPEGATRKDGPSAGIAILVLLVSLMTQKRVKNRIAMTGEITLRGKVLPVGGIKEKILAAKRSKIKEIILSEYNRSDVEHIEEKYLRGIEFHFVSDMMEVIEIAVTNQKAVGFRRL